MKKSSVLISFISWLWVMSQFFGTPPTVNASTFQLELLEPRIIGGAPAQPGAWPWMAALVSGPNPYTSQYCGGSLIHPNWVVTAAHCVFDQTGGLMSSLDVVLGTNDLRASPDAYERIRVSEIIPHPSYDPNTFDNDIALLRLSQSSGQTPIRWITPELALSLALPGDLATVAGWGITRNFATTRPESLMQVTIPIISNTTCGQVYYITDNMMCAGFAEGGKDACLGDSGGPFMSPDGQGGYLLAGIVSSGAQAGCALPGLYGVYTRVSNYADWLTVYVGSTPLPCSLTISPASQTFSSNGGTASVSVTTQNDCSWSASSEAPWITITSGSGGAGPGTILYSVAPNPSSNPRSSSLKIQDQILSVTQNGALIIGGAGAGKTVTANVDTNLHNELTLLLSQQAIDGQGRIYISFEAPSVPAWSDYLWLRPNESQTPPYLVLARTSSGFLPSASSDFYYQGVLSAAAGDAVFTLGELKGLAGERFVFKSWYTASESSFNPSDMVLIQSVHVSLF
jgi:secreted trypsin-like serine protease